MLIVDCSWSYQRGKGIQNKRRHVSFHEWVLKIALCWIFKFSDALFFVLFTFKANWDWIRQIKEQLDIPVFANGSIGKFEDIQACMDITKCDGVMSSEGVLENPALFEGPISDSLSDLEHFRRKVSKTGCRFIKAD